jgi:hypothetical protein
MNKLALVTAALVGAAVLVTASALAQPATPSAGTPPAAADQEPGTGNGWGPGAMMGPGMMGWGGRRSMGMLCNPRAAGLAEWRMERIERLVQPTEAQRAALNDLRTASTKAAEQIAAACPRDLPASAPARLELMEKRMESMLAALKTVRPAFVAFYGTLTDEQKARLDQAGPRRWGWRDWGRKSQ